MDLIRKTAYGLCLSSASCAHSWNSIVGNGDGIRRLEYTG